MKVVDYGKEANTYDDKRYGGEKNKYIYLTDAFCLKTLLPNNKQIEIVDVGSGTGRGVILIVKEGFQKIIGLDVTKAMLDICKKKLENINRVKGQSILLINANAGCLPFSDESKDCIISLNFMHLFTIENQKILIDEMARVVRAGGIIICEFNNYYKGFIAGKLILKENPSLHLNKKKDFKILFSNPSLKITIIRGSSLPYLWRVFKYIPNIGKIVDKLGYYNPFKMIAPKYFVVAKKL